MNKLNSVVEIKYRTVSRFAAIKCHRFYAHWRTVAAGEAVNRGVAWTLKMAKTAKNYSLLAFNA